MVVRECGSHFGGNANESICVLRYANVNNEPSNSNTNIGSSLRVIGMIFNNQLG